MEEVADRVVVVLCRPEEPGNIGSACRAMKTMGITRLRIVGQGGHDVRQIRFLAVHAFDVFERAGHFASLPEALGDTVLSAGVTRRRGAKRKTVSLLPEELAERVARIERGLVGVVFGNERDGLTDDELAECSLAVHIPSSRLYPSLNLSHAVQIVCYALHNELVRPARFTPVARERIDSLTESVIASLGSVGFFTSAGSALMSGFLREILARASLSRSEADRVEKLFKKVENLHLHRKEAAP